MRLWPHPEPMRAPIDAEAEAVGAAVMEAHRNSERMAMEALVASQHFETANSRVQAFIAGMLAEAEQSKRAGSP